MFQQFLDTRKIEKTPIIEVFKKHPKEILLSACCECPSRRLSLSSPRSSSLTPSVPCTCRDLILIAVLVASCVSFVIIPLSGCISDRIGRGRCT